MSLIDAAQKKAAATAKSKGKVYEAKNTYYTGKDNSNIEDTSLGESVKKEKGDEKISDKQKPIVIGQDASKDYGVYQLDKEKEMQGGNYGNLSDADKLKYAIDIKKGQAPGTEEMDARNKQIDDKRAARDKGHVFPEVSTGLKTAIDLMETKKAKEYIYKKVGEGKVEKIEKK